MKFLRPFADRLLRRETQIGGSDGNAGDVLSLFGDRYPKPAADAWLSVSKRPQLTEGDVQCTAADFEQQREGTQGIPIRRDGQLRV